MSRRGGALLAALLALAVACVGWWYVSVEMPRNMSVTADWTSLRPVGGRLPRSLGDVFQTSVSLGIDVSVANRNLLPIDLHSVDYRIWVNGVDVGGGVHEPARPPLRLRADSMTPVRIEPTVSVARGLLAPILGVGENRWTLRLVGVARAGIGPLALERPFDLTGLKLRWSLR